MCIWAVLTYVTIYWVNQGYSHFQVGVLVAVFPLVSLVLMIPFGIFVDRIAPKKLVITSLFIFAAGLAGLLAVQDFWQTLGFVALGGAGNALFNNALPALYFKSLGDKIRGFKLGIFNAALLIGYGLGPFFGGFIMPVYGMNGVIVFSMLGLVPSFVLCLFLNDVPGSMVRLSDYRTDLSSKSAIVFIILVFLFSLHAGAEQSSFSLYLNKEVGLDDSMVGLLFFIHADVMAILAVFNGIIGDRFNARGRGLAALFYSGIIVSGITNISLFFATSFGTVLATRLSHALGDSMVMVTRSLITSNLFISSRMGGNLGVVTTTVTLATLVGAVISGAVPGYASGFVIAGALAILAIPLVILTKPEF